MGFESSVFRQAWYSIKRSLLSLKRSLHSHWLHSYCLSLFRKRQYTSFVVPRKACNPFPLHAWFSLLIAIQRYGNQHSVLFEQIELAAKLLDSFLRSNKFVCVCTHTHVFLWICVFFVCQCVCVLLLLLLLLLLLVHACVKRENFSSRTMKVCEQHLQRLHAVCFNSMCGYMCRGRQIDQSVCLPLLISMRYTHVYIWIDSLWMHLYVWTVYICILAWIVYICILAFGCILTLCFSCAHIQGSCADILSSTYIVHTLV